jgi:acetyl-CoA acyltransferase 1
MAAFSKAARNVLHKSPNDVVLLSAVRSPISRSFKGGYKDAHPEDILMPVSFGKVCGRLYLAKKSHRS